MTTGQTLLAIAMILGPFVIPFVLWKLLTANVKRSTTSIVAALTPFMLVAAVLALAVVAQQVEKEWAQCPPRITQVVICE